MSILCIIQPYCPSEHGLVPLEYDSEQRDSILNSYIVHYDETTVDNIKEVFDDVTEAYSKYVDVQGYDETTMKFPFLAYATPETIGNYYITKEYKPYAHF